MSAEHEFDPPRSRFEDKLNSWQDAVYLPVPSDDVLPVFVPLQAVRGLNPHIKAAHAAQEVIASIQDGIGETHADSPSKQYLADLEEQFRESVNLNRNYSGDYLVPFQLSYDHMDVLQQFLHVEPQAEGIGDKGAVVNPDEKIIFLDVLRERFQAAGGEVRDPLYVPLVQKKVTQHYYEHEATPGNDVTWRVDALKAQYEQREHTPVAFPVSLARFELMQIRGLMQTAMGGLEKLRSESLHGSSADELDNLLKEDGEFMELREKFEAAYRDMATDTDRKQAIVHISEPDIHLLTTYIVQDSLRAFPFDDREKRTAPVQRMLLKYIARGGEGVLEDELILSDKLYRGEFSLPFLQQGSHKEADMDVSSNPNLILLKTQKAAEREKEFDALEELSVSVCGSDISHIVANLYREHSRIDTLRDYPYQGPATMEWADHVLRDRGEFMNIFGKFNQAYQLYTADGQYPQKNQMRISQTDIATLVQHIVPIDLRDDTDGYKKTNMIEPVQRLIDQFKSVGGNGTEDDEEKIKKVLEFAQRDRSLRDENISHTTKNANELTIQPVIKEDVTFEIAHTDTTRILTGMFGVKRSVEEKLMYSFQRSVNPAEDEALIAEDSDFTRLLIKINSAFITADENKLTDTPIQITAADIGILTKLFLNTLTAAPDDHTREELIDPVIRVVELYKKSGGGKIANSEVEINRVNSLPPREPRF